MLEELLGKMRVHEYLVFKRWEDVPSNLKTKTQLRRMHLVPESESEWDGELSNEEWFDVPLYDMTRATYVIPRNEIPAVAFPITKEYLMLALEIVRTSKEKHKMASEFGWQKAHTNQKNMLEDLEAKVLKKFKQEHIRARGTKILVLEKIRIKDAVATLQKYVEEI